MLSPLLLIFFPECHGEDACIIADVWVIVLLLLLELLLILVDVLEEEDQVHLVEEKAGHLLPDIEIDLDMGVVKLQLFIQAEELG